MNEIKEFGSIVGYEFKDIDIIQEALTHTSYSHENRININYERLEFLGDAVLQLIITEYLIIKYKDFDEGNLSKYRGYFVSEEFLSKIAQNLNIGRFIRLGKGESLSGGFTKPSLLCDIFESVIAAIYLDGGYNDARRVFISYASDEIDSIIFQKNFLDYKSELQKFTQKRYEVLPEYRIIREEGPEHEKNFFVTVSVNGEVISEGEGRSKKKAEQSAAKSALDFYYNES